MSYLAMLKAARASTKETKKEPSSLPRRSAGVRNNERRGGGWRPTYAHPWPDEMPGLGPRHVGSFDPCEGCGRGSWARYGGTVLCCPCAIARLEDPPAPEKKLLPW